MFSIIGSSGARASGVFNAQPVRSIYSSSVVLAKKKIDPSLPVPPKSAPSAYTLFFKDFFAREKDAYNHPETGKLQVAEIARAAGTAWVSLPEGDKEKYTREAKVLKQNFDTEYRKFFTSLSDETRRAIEKRLGKKLNVPGGKRNAKLEENKELASRAGFPGKPTTSFFVFLKEVKEEMKSEIEGSEGLEAYKKIASTAGERWKAMTEEQKQVYKEKSEQAKKVYNEWMKTQ